MSTPASPETLARLIAVVGPAGAITDPTRQAPYLQEPRGLWRGTTPVVLRPSSTEQVSAILRIAHETGTTIAPQSGNTGLVGGQTPSRDGTEIVLSLDRMHSIITVDAANATMTVEAGAILKNVQAAADAVDMLFPLSLASEGSCRIGGNLATNAGGLNVLAYGNARDLCLGLEVVLADGRVLSTLRTLRKDNTGYDLRNIFIGSEGTLGIITKAVLKLFPKPKQYATAFIAAASPAKAIALLNHFRKSTSNQLVAFEMIPKIGIEFVTRHHPLNAPVALSTGWYVLAELANANAETMEGILAEALQNGLVEDAAIAQSETQRQQFWAMRELMSETQKLEGGSIKHDVSLPLSNLAQFIDEATPATQAVVPGSRVVCFGHLGDGNMHFNVSQPVGMDKQAYLDQWNAMNDAVHDVVIRLSGSVSAEHGIGRLKVKDMPKIKSQTELAVMHGLKQLFDPKNILNPGRVLPD